MQISEVPVGSEQPIHNHEPEQCYYIDRTNQGRHCQGRTPMQTFLDGLALYDQYVYDTSERKEAA